MASSVGSVVFSISADIKDIQGQLRQIEGQFAQSANKISSSLKSIGTSVGSVFAVSAIINFGKSIVDLGGQLTDLARQSDFSAQALSGIKSTLEENGTSLEAFAKGMFVAQKNLGDITKATDPAAIAIKELGLNLDELRNGNAEQFAEKLTDALGKQENTFKRNSLAAAILGKNYKELKPALEDLAGKFAELKKQGISEEDIRTLDEFGDAWTRFSNKIKIASAGFLASAIRDLETIGELVRRNIALFNTGTAGTGGLIGAAGSSLTGMSEALKNATNASSAKGNAPFKPSIAAGDIDKLKAAIDAYTKSLQAAIGKEEEQRIKLQYNEVTSLKAAQAFDVLALKEKLLAEGLKIPPQVQADVAAATATLKSLGVNVDQLSSKDFPKLRDEYLRLAEANQMLTKAMEQANKQMEAESRIVGDNAKKKEEALSVLKQYQELIQGLQVGAIKDPENRRIAGIEVEFAKTAAKIKELGEATGKSQTEIAEMIALAWKKSLNEINDKVDESSQFTIEALRNIQDSMAEFISGALDGNLKGWKAWAEGVRKTINSLVANQLAAKLNEIVFGPKAGQSKGQIGGLAGQGIDWLKGLFGSKPPLPAPTGPGAPPNAPPIPTINTSIGGGLVDNATQAAATAAIESQAVVASASIETVGVTAGAGIEAQVLAATASLEAVTAAALAAIEAAAAAAAAGGAGGGGSVAGGTDLFSKFFGASGLAGGETGQGTPSANSGGFLSTGSAGLTDFAGYARGGRPTPMMPAIVGERGPELFIPDRAGTVVPNGKWGGAGSVTVNVYAKDAASFRGSEHHIYTTAAAALARQQNR